MLKANANVRRSGGEAEPSSLDRWIPAFAGMTESGHDVESGNDVGRGNDIERGDDNQNSGQDDRPICCAFEGAV